MSFDVIVIGSGFGGAITGCRLAEKGYKVLILERGRRWTKETYPSTTKRNWIYNHYRPERESGWLDLRVYPNMSIAQGAGVGGGSLIYASISVEARPDIFEMKGWPAEITYDELKPHYDTVAKFMNVQKMPENQLNPRTHIMKNGAEKLGHGDRFHMLTMAVTFDPDLKFDVNNPPKIEDSKQFTNAQGVKQGTCVHTGFCDIGCPVYAKNTLDLNYIPWAEKHGADVREMHLVTNIEPQAGGYRVSFDRIDKDKKRRIPGSETARIVIIAAGSLGSTELLLRCRDENKSLPNISRFLGRNWSSNGDFLTPAIYSGQKVYPDRGPTISSMIDFRDRSYKGQSFWIEDGGMPNLLGDRLTMGAAKIGQRVGCRVTDFRDTEVPARLKHYKQRDAVVCSRCGCRRRRAFVEAALVAVRVRLEEITPELGHHEIASVDERDSRYAQGALKGDRRHGNRPPGLDRVTRPDNAAPARRLQPGQYGRRWRGEPQRRSLRLQEPLRRRRRDSAYGARRQPLANDRRAGRKNCKAHSGRREVGGSYFHSLVNFVRA